MSVPAAPNPLSFSQIATEFGNVTNKNIGAYRISQSIAGRNWSLDDGIPTSGTIKFSDFRGKTCNVVVDYIGDPTTSEGTAISNYTNNGVVVGGLKSLPSSSETKKVYHIIRRTIGNGLSSGTWDANTVLLAFIITGSGSIYGYGGRGGDGANIDESAPNADTSFYSERTNSMRYGAQSGGHALTVDYNSTVIVEQNGILAGGGGGGGGGGYRYNGGPDARGAGCGGGGGAGYPAGNGGAAGYVNDGGRNGNVCQGNAGSAGTLLIGGNGAPSTCGLTGGGNGGQGGNGGNIAKPGLRGGDRTTSAGSPGSAGNAVYHPGYSLSLISSGTVYGNY